MKRWRVVCVCLVTLYPCCATSRNYGKNVAATHQEHRRPRCCLARFVFYLKQHFSRAALFCNTDALSAVVDAQQRAKSHLERLEGTQEELRKREAEARSLIDVAKISASELLSVIISVILV
jgi:hypothetical protein